MELDKFKSVLSEEVGKIKSNIEDKTAKDISDAI